jgi:SAM-dependent methyltransferase
MDPPSKTQQTFYDKWQNNKELAFLETQSEGSIIFNWIITRNGWSDAAGLAAFLKNKKRVLDAGCGNGRVTAILRKYSEPAHCQIIGIDLVAATVAAKNLIDQPNMEFKTKDLLDDLSDLGKFDFIYCQEVLHHTNDPKKAFQNLCAILEPNGEIAVYLYRQKAPAREFVDDYIRNKIVDLPYEEAMKVCREITELGRRLSELNVKVKVPEVKALEIEAGEYDVQRLLYHFFFKCYWNPELDFEANAVINYDWYHPQLCARFQPDEIMSWFEETGLEVVHRHIDHYGITIRGRR